MQICIDIDSNTYEDNYEFISNIFSEIALFRTEIRSGKQAFGPKRWYVYLDLDNINPKFINWKEIGDFIFNKLGSDSQVFIQIYDKFEYFKIGKDYDGLANVEIKVIRVKPDVVDDETAIMSALAHGDGDSFGFD